MDKTEEVSLVKYAQSLEAEIERLRAALVAARPYVAKAADNFGSEWTSAEVLNQIDKVLNEQLARDTEK